MSSLYSKPPNMGEVVFTDTSQTYTWNTPAGTTDLEFFLIGGGGGAGSDSSNYVGGKGGSCNVLYAYLNLAMFSYYISTVSTIPPGTKSYMLSLSITVGQGGTGQIPGTGLAGSPGTSSSIAILPNYAYITSSYGNGGGPASSSSPGVNGTENTGVIQSDLPYSILNLNPTLRGEMQWEFGQGGKAGNNGYQGIVIIRWYRGLSLLNP